MSKKLLLVLLYLLILCNARKSSTTISSAGVINRFLNLRPDVIIYLDGDNIRGKSGFRLSKEALYAKVSRWTEKVKVENRVVLVYDHGPVHCGHDIHNFACVFSGPGRTADDVIAKAVHWCSNKNVGTVVVTSDSQLKSRCRLACRSGQKESFSVDSTLFVAMLISLCDEDEVDFQIDSKGIESDIGKKIDFNGSDKLNFPSDNTALANISQLTITSDDSSNATISSIVDISLLDQLSTTVGLKASLARKERSLGNQILAIDNIIKNGSGKKKISKVRKVNN